MHSTNFCYFEEKKESKGGENGIYNFFFKITQSLVIVGRKGTKEKKENGKKKKKRQERKRTLVEVPSKGSLQRGHWSLERFKGRDSVLKKKKRENKRK